MNRYEVGVISPQFRGLGIVNTDQPLTPDLLHAQTPLQSFLGNRENVLLVPNAAGGRDGAFNRHSEALMSVAGVRSLHRLDHMMDLPEEEIKKILSKVEGIYVSGGNTFRLSQEMHHSAFPWAEYITEMAREGRPYVGVSAGLLMAQKRFEVCFDEEVAPSNKGFDLVNLKNTQIGVHFESEDNHGPSTADLQPFVTQNRSVLALNDGTWLRAEKGQLHFEGVEGMKAAFMRAGQPVQSIPVGTDLSYLLS